MTAMEVRGRIVVGAEGSAASVAAVRWAVREARLRHAAVHLLCACDSDARLRSPSASWSWETREDERYAAAAAELAATADIARSHLPAGWLTAELVREPAARALLNRAADAVMLVLGTTRFARGTGQPPRAVGPVTRACLRHAPCPVVVVGLHDLPADPPAERADLATGQLLSTGQVDTRSGQLAGWLRPGRGHAGSCSSFGWRAVTVVRRCPEPALSAGSGGCRGTAAPRPAHRSVRPASPPSAPTRSRRAAARRPATARHRAASPD
jgi:nucleotide-binding universal stress UspA family protein